MLKSNTFLMYAVSFTEAEAKGILRTPGTVVQSEC